MAAGIAALLWTVACSSDEADQREVLDAGAKAHAAEVEATGGTGTGTQRPGKRDEASAGKNAGAMASEDDAGMKDRSKPKVPGTSGASAPRPMGAHDPMMPGQPMAAGAGPMHDRAGTKASPAPKGAGDMAPPPPPHAGGMHAPPAPHAEGGMHAPPAPHDDGGVPPPHGP